MICLTVPKLFIIKNVDKNKSHTIIIQILKNYFKIRNPKVIRNEHGKPYVLNEKVFFNISYSDDLMICLVSSTEVGVDIEKKRKYNKNIVKKIFSQCEQEKMDIDKFLEYWTIKESYLKYKGIGIIDELYKVEIENEGEYKIKNDTPYVCVRRFKDYVIAICSEDRISALDIKYI